MKREVQGPLLMLVGLTTLRISVGETYLRYVKEGLQPFLIFAGVVLVVLGLMAAFGKSEPTAADAHAEGHTHMDGHNHEGGPTIAWLLLLPVMAIFLIAHPALGAYAASRSGGGVARPAEEAFDPLPAGDPVEVKVTDYAARSIWGGEETLRDRRLKLTGFAVERPEGGWYVARMSMACCAADALPTRIEVRGDVETPAVGTWVELIGSWEAPEKTFTDDAVPVVRAETLTPIEQPRVAYE